MTTTTKKLKKSKELPLDVGDRDNDPIFHEKSSVFDATLDSDKKVQWRTELQWTRNQEDLPETCELSYDMADAYWYAATDEFLIEVHRSHDDDEDGWAVTFYARMKAQDGSSGPVGFHHGGSFKKLRSAIAAAEDQIREWRETSMVIGVSERRLRGCLETSMTFVRAGKLGVLVGKRFRVYGLATFETIDMDIYGTQRNARVFDLAQHRFRTGEDIPPWPKLFQLIDDAPSAD